MISALHPVTLPMEKYPDSIQTERLMSIFSMDSTHSLTEHLTSIKTIEKGFLSFASLPVTYHTYLCLYPLPINSYKSSLPLQNLTEII